MDVLRAVAGIVAAYCRAADTGDADGIADLFVEGGQLTLHGRSLVGRSAIREGTAELLRDSPPTSHASWGTRLRVRDGVLSAVTQFVTYVPSVSDRPQRRGTWEDEFVRENATLRLRARVVRFDEAMGSAAKSL